MTMLHRSESSPRNTKPRRSGLGSASPQRKQGIFAPLRAARRSGISIIEVLTAIVVALIGLAGVLVMIPFAVNQAQVGMDTEKSAQLARNASAELEIRNTLESSPPLESEITSPSGYATRPNSTARSYCLDPIGVASRSLVSGQNTGSFPFVLPATEAALVAQNQATGVEGGGYDQMFFVQRASIVDPLGAPPLPQPRPLRLSTSRAQFGWTEDLQSRAVTDAEFADPTLNVPGPTQYPSKDLILPLQIFDQTATTAGLVLNARRQSVGEMNWMVISSPSGITPQLAVGAADAGAGTPGYCANMPLNQLVGANDLVSELRNFYVVFKKRPMPAEIISVPPSVVPSAQPYDRVYQVDYPGVTVTAGAATATDNSFRTGYNGGLLKLREECIGYSTQIPAIPGGPAGIKASNDLSSQRAEIRRGDWIALTNVRYDYGLGRFVQGWNFFRVTEAAPSVDFLGPHWAVTLEGPEWDFQRQYQINSVAPGLGPSDPTYTPGTPPTWGPPTFVFGFARVATAGSNYNYFPTSTMAVHLPDVWAVFERTVRLGSD